jgi:hypothetical protein
MLLLFQGAVRANQGTGLVAYTGNPRAEIAVACTVAFSGERAKLAQTDAAHPGSLVALSSKWESGGPGVAVQIYTKASPMPVEVVLRKVKISTFVGEGNEIQIPVSDVFHHGFLIRDIEKPLLIDGDDGAVIAEIVCSLKA